MTIYSAPLSDIEFSLNSFVDLPSIMKYDHFGEADHSMVSDLLAEAGRFMADIFAPLNKSGTTKAQSEMLTEQSQRHKALLRHITHMSKPDGVRFPLILVLAAGDFLLLSVSRFKK